MKGRNSQLFITPVQMSLTWSLKKFLSQLLYYSETITKVERLPPLPNIHKILLLKSYEVWLFSLTAMI
jgi:hypothetical protein